LNPVQLVAEMVCDVKAPADLEATKQRVMVVSPQPLRMLMQ
jgi:hypothetical protein